MKIQITQDQPDRVGYLNTEEIDITKICQKYQCDELYCPDVFNFLTFEESQSFLQNISTWLAPGTPLTIGGTDIYILSKTLISRSIDLFTVNKILLERNRPLLSVHSTSEIKEILISLGFSISDIQVDYTTGAFTIEARK